MWRIVLMVALAIGLAATASGTSAQTGGGTLRAESQKVVVGQTSQVWLLGAWDIPGPDTIAYSVTMHFNADFITVSGCTSDAEDSDSTCERSDESTVVFSSASSAPPTWTNAWKLGLVDLTCTRAGIVNVTVAISSWQSSMPDAPPQPDVQGGVLTCVTNLPTLSVQSATGIVGQPVAVNIVVSDMPEPGLGAWTVDVTYDETRLDVALPGCAANFGSVCSMSYFSTHGRQGRFTGAFPTGLQGTFTIGTAYFQCRVQGATPLVLSASVFADATPGSPQNINVQIQNGSITCLTELPTAAPTATPTPPSSLPAAGGGASSSQPVAPWWPFALLAAGGAAAFGAALVRRRA